MDNADNNIGKSITYIAMLESGIKQITDNINGITEVGEDSNQYYILENKDNIGYKELSISGPIISIN